MLVNKKQLLIDGLKKDEALIHFLIVWTLCLRGSKHTQCFEVDITIIYGIINDILIHWTCLNYDIIMKAKRYPQYPLPYALLVSRICEYKGVNTFGEASQRTHNESKIRATYLHHMFILQGNTYIHRDDIGNPEDKDEDQQNGKCSRYRWTF
ncbi:hypothetical protein V8G54_034425 [Vigna mungo]|uniref:Uncharacterized protein n=1 Tax=Vigna mungo TaxID=3915 RepID=A0AAQ3RJQ1_VIGMU